MPCNKPTGAGYFPLIVSEPQTDLDLACTFPGLHPASALEVWPDPVAPGRLYTPDPTWLKEWQPPAMYRISNIYGRSAIDHADNGPR